ncbi:MAG: hypothetical protein DME77_04060 [Verrucomicrobia bacterium]|nr:MAG: hypothetical protein DME77_04060 [Verrucomicrobiota bacterium]
MPSCNSVKAAPFVFLGPILIGVIRVICGSDKKIQNFHVISGRISCSTSVKGNQRKKNNKNPNRKRNNNHENKIN